MPGMIKKEDIEKVRATADLYDIVSATVAGLESRPPRASTSRNSLYGTTPVAMSVMM